MKFRTLRAPVDCNEKEFVDVCSLSVMKESGSWRDKRMDGVVLQYGG